jgi:flagellar capping protein FliD
LKLTAVISDSTKLDKALKENFSEVQKLVDRVTTNIENKLAKYTGTTSYIDQKIKATDTQTTNVANQITTWNKRLEQRKATLTNLYTDVQAQLTSLSYTSNTNSAWINSLYSSLNS